MKTRFTNRRVRQAYSGLAHDTFGDFVCSVCHRYVCAAAAFSGVQHRNHCPYCLSSRHLDLYKAGDRLSACKAPMQPVALALKRTLKKYAQPGQGEIMLVHLCQECGKASLNRIAADDDSEAVLGIFESSQTLDVKTWSLLNCSGITLLGVEDRPIVHRQLTGGY